MGIDRKKEIIIFSLGPVQSFISASRRTQDLAVSSRILSLVSRAGLDSVPREAEIIYPQKLSRAWPESLPNRTVIIDSSGNGACIAKGMEDKAREYWRDNIAKTVRSWFNGKAMGDQRTGADAWGKMGDQQVEEFLEIYWVVQPWEGQDTTYGPSYRKASLALEARKYLRHYPVNPQPGQKCTICGVRSAIGGDFHWQNIQRKVLGSLLRSGERLCAICLIKRFAVKAKITDLQDFRPFLSTSSLASISFRIAVLRRWDTIYTQAKTFLNDLDALELLNIPPDAFGGVSQDIVNDPNKAKLFRFDGDALYDEFYTEENIKEAAEKTSLTRKQLELVKSMPGMDGSLGKLKKIVKELQFTDEELRAGAATFPHTYYAILALDGDHMGALLDNVSSLDDHRKLSQALASAATHMRDIVEREYPGRVVYASGDDCLAILPVSCSFNVAEKLRQSFEGKLNPVLEPSSASASIGFTIAHHKSPLEYALTSVRAMERTAKETYERNALAVQVNRRSGETRELGLHWKESEILQCVEELMRRITTGQLSGKFAYEFQSEAAVLPWSALELELGRLIKRHHNNDSWDNTTERKKLARQLTEFVNALPEDSRKNQLEQISDWALMARFMAEGDRVEGGQE